MAKGIRHWLIATGLAESIPSENKMHRRELEATELGKLVWEHDPYFMEETTWWILHVNLANTPKQAGSWFWFFGHFGFDRFEKSVCLDRLRKYLESQGSRMPSVRTLERDLGCLLQSYAHVIPPYSDDPEEVNTCPLSELKLLTYYRSSGYYQLNLENKEIPFHAFAYSFATSFDQALTLGQTYEIPLLTVARKRGGPARVFALTNEGLFDLVQRYEAECSQTGIAIGGLAGERTVKLQWKEPLDWIEECYSSQAVPV
jgi:hypothetical protein